MGAAPWLPAPVLMAGWLEALLWHWPLAYCSRDHTGGSVSAQCGRLVTCRLVCLLPPAQEQLRVPQMARSSHSDTELEEPTQLAVSSYLATGGSSWGDCQAGAVFGA